jgi:dienelactone hydrolase
MGRWRRRAALVPLALLVAACSSGSGANPSDTGASTVGSVPAGSTGGGSAPPGTAATSGPTAYAQPGPYPVGYLELDSPTGPISVWYPGEPGTEAGQARATYDLRTYLPPAEQAKVADLQAAVHEMDAYPELQRADTAQPFPLVLFSHGFCGYRQQSSFLTSAMASWGFVVAAPEHLSRDLTSCLAGTIGQAPSGDVDDLRGAIPILEAANISEEGPLATIVDTTKVAVVGHSAGGAAAIRMSGDPAVTAYAALAAGGGTAGSTPPPAAKPALYIAGDADAIAPLPAIEQWWTSAVPSPKRLAALSGVTHLGFMDLCTIAADQGGAFQAFQTAGGSVPEVITHLVADGCDPKHTAATDAWPAIDHLVVAHLRSAFGIDPAPVGLDTSVADAYPGLTISYQEG